MSSTAIGKAALILTTNATGLRSGLADAGRDARHWADATAGNINSRLKDVGKDTGKGGFLAGGGKLAAAAAVAVGGVASVREAIQTLDDVARGGAAAKAFGLTAEQFTGMAGVAESVGEGQREFIESLVTLGKVAEEGAAGKGEVATAWFKTLNLDAQKFKGLNLEEKFFRVFEAIHKVEDPAARVRSLMVAFGEDGGKFLLPLLAKAPSEIRSMASSFAVSSKEVEKATAANAQLTQAGNTLKAGWRTIVIALAPAIGTIGGMIGRLKPVFDWLGRAFEAVSDIVLGAFRGIGTGGALMWDTIKAGVGLVLTALGGFVSGLSYVTDAFSELVQMAKLLPESMKPSWVDDFADGVARTSNLVQDTGRVLRQWGADAMNGWGDSAIQFNGWLDGIANKTNGSLHGIANKTKEQVVDAAKQTIATTTQMAAALTKFDNASLIKGSSAEVSARIKYDFKGQTAQDRMLEEQRKANKELGGINAGVKKIAARPLVDLDSF